MDSITPVMHPSPRSPEEAFAALSKFRPADADLPVRATPSPEPPKMQIEAAVLDAIRREIGERPAEHGGVLGGSREDGVIRHFYFDQTGRRTGATYSPDHVTVNKLLDEVWNAGGINLLGFVHSHPSGPARPSGGDMVYARNILRAIPQMEHLLLPIVMTVPNTGTFELLPFRAVRTANDILIQRMELVVTPSPDETVVSSADEAMQPGGDLAEVPSAFLTREGRWEQLEIWLLMAALGAVLAVVSGRRWLRALARRIR